MDAIDRIPTLHNKGAGVREKLLNLQLAAKNTAYENGIDPEYVRNWRWPYPKKAEVVMARTGL